MISEAALAAAVRAYLESQGWTVYQEVSLDFQRRGASPVGDGRADIVATRDGQLAVVECKVGLTLELIAQGRRWIPYANIIWLAFPEARRSVSRDAGVEIARSLGFGLLRVDGDEIRTFGSPRVRPHLESDALLVSLRDGHKTHAEAGTNRGGQWTSCKETWAALAAYVAANKGCKLEEAVASIKHHYSSQASAVASLRKRLRREDIPDVYPGWRQGLYPTKEEARGPSRGTVQSDG